MKEKIHYAIETALAVAVITLFVLYFMGGKNTSNTKEVVSNEESVTNNMSIAYIDVDSLMENYTYAIDLKELLAKDIENSHLKFTERARKFQTKYEEFQRKVETGSFLSRERAEAEQQSLIKEQDDLQKMEAQLTQELNEKQFRWTESMRQVIIVQLKEFNAEKGYHFIFGKMADNILYANDTYNLTAEVIEYLNRKYASDPPLKPNN